MTLLAEYLEALLLEHRIDERAYHNRCHVAQMMSFVTQFRPFSQAMHIAVMLHDIICTPGATDNEERSCIEVDRLDIPGALKHDIKRLIMLTKHHDPKLNDRSGCILVAGDLSILAAAPEKGDGYEDYCMEIRKEFDFLSDDEWRDGRSK